MKLRMSACIEAKKDQVWKVLSDISNVNLWVDPIISANCEGNIKHGVGTIRTCKLKGNMTIREKWVEWDEGNSFTYHAEETSFFKSAKNKWTVKSEKQKTLVITESEVTLQGGIFGKIFEPLMYLVSKKMGAESLAALKYLVETGKPFKRKFSKLPRVQIGC
ncbi:MAG: SRPBCC family protein [Pseudomonadota bacterium]